MLRSEVKICLKADTWEDIKTIKTVQEFLEWVKPSILIERNDIVIVGWNDIKWFKEYGGIGEIMQYLKDIDNTEIPYKFIQIPCEGDYINILENYVDGSCDKIFEKRSIGICL